jgi:CRP-like cAMP-binding protein
MSSQKLIQFLHGSKHMSLTTATEIAGIFSFKEMERNNFLLKEGKVCNEYLFLEKGFMRSFAYDTDGNDVSTNFCMEGQVVFEVSSFFNRTPSKENIQAITDCTGWTITYEQLNNLFHSLPEFRISDDQY